MTTSDFQEFYVTFGVKHPQEPHETFPQAHADGYLVIEAVDEEEARRLANAKLGNDWAFIYDSSNFKFHLHPLGELGRISQTVRD